MFVSLMVAGLGGVASRAEICRAVQAWGLHPSKTELMQLCAGLEGWPRRTEIVLMCIFLVAGLGVWLTEIGNVC
jgi:hypothetical protein